MSHAGLSDSVWIGGTDTVFEGEFEWISTETQILVNKTYTNWIPGRPDDYGQAGEDCLCMSHGQNYKWDDRKCDEHNNFLCERKRIRYLLISFYTPCKLIHFW